MADGIARGMAHLSASHLIRRDLACRATQTNTPKVADFVMSCIVALGGLRTTDNDDNDDKMCGPEYYRSQHRALAVP